MTKRRFQAEEYAAEQTERPRRGPIEPEAWGVMWNDPRRETGAPVEHIGTFNEQCHARVYATRIPGGGTVFPLWGEILTERERVVVETLCTEVDGSYPELTEESAAILRGLLARNNNCVTLRTTHP